MGKLNLLVLILILTGTISYAFSPNFNGSKNDDLKSLREIPRQVYSIDPKFTWVNADRVSVAITPDGSFNLVKNAINSAQKYIYIEIYQFWSDDIFNLIDSTLRENPDIDVAVLIENDTGYRGQQDNPDKFNIRYAYKLHQLSEKGYNVTVKLETSWNYYHGKLIIVDGKLSLVSSENFIPTAFPPDPTNVKRPKYGDYIYYSKPSRGWVALIEDEEATRYFLRIFLNDFKKAESYDPNIHGTGLDFTGSSPKTFQPLSPSGEIATNVLLKPISSPKDSWGNITDLLSRANHTVLIEQMYIYESAWDLVDLLHDLHANKGVTVYVIVEDDDPGNYNEIKDNLTQLGFHVVPAFGSNEILFLHNKGIIVDDRFVFVGSINWSGGSFDYNREFGVIIDSREIASFLRTVYGFDWDKSKGANIYPFDSDSDGLPDYYEIEHGLNRLSEDTDGDGISDYEEVYGETAPPLEQPSSEKNKIIQFLYDHRYEIIALTIILLVLIIGYLRRR